MVNGDHCVYSDCCCREVNDDVCGHGHANDHDDDEIYDLENEIEMNGDCFDLNSYE